MSESKIKTDARAMPQVDTPLQNAGYMNARPYDALTESQTASPPRALMGAWITFAQPIHAQRVAQATNLFPFKPQRIEFTRC